MKQKVFCLVWGGLLIVSSAGLGFFSVACAQNAQQSEPASKRVLAVVKGEPLLEEVVREAAEEELRQLELARLRAEAQYQLNRHEILEKTLKRLVAEKLVAQEAASRGLTTEELLAAEVGAQLEEPSEEEIQNIYQINRNRIRQPLEEIRPQIVAFLKEHKREQAYEDYIERLKEKYAVELNWEPLRVTLETEGFPSRGPDDAPVTIVEFSDFECPFCSRLVPTLKKIEEAYGNKVRVVFRQFPLADIHARALKAAEASLCAHEQGRFWEMHDLLFAEPRRLEISDLKAKAAQLELDQQEFEQCLDSGKYADFVQQELLAGARAGVSGTPALFVNGRPLPGGALPYEEIAQVIDEELARSSSSGP